MEKDNSRFKFRAWYENKMHEASGYYTDGSARIGLSCFPYTQTVYPDSIMQFTGLHDKNGTEIYEGDILGIENTSFGIVDYHNERGAWILHDEDNYNELLFLQNPMPEVIGNIFEHPHLIE